MNSSIKVVLLAIGLFLGNNVYSQESAMSPNEKKKLESELIAKRDELFRAHGLNTMNDKALKRLIGDRICFKRIDGRTTIYKTYTGSQKDTILGTDILEVIKVHTMNTNIKYRYMKVRRNDEVIIIPASDYDEFIKLSVRDSITQVLDNMRQEAENNAQEARNREWQENLAEYRASLAQFGQSQTGPIAVKPKERAYDGKEPFREFIQGTYNVKDKLATIQDELFVFHPTRKAQFKGNQQLLADTFGICLPNSERYRFDTDFIDLRTGEILRFNDMINFIESCRYMNVLSQASDFVYDGTYSLAEILNPKRFTPDNTEKMCEALVGEQVFVLRSLQYDEITSVERTTYNGEEEYRLHLKNGDNDLRSGEYYGRRSVVSVKWYQHLQQFIGKEVLLVRTNWNFNVNAIYKEDLPKLGPWTVVNIEAKEEDQWRNDIFVTLQKGNDREIVRAESCMLLTHDIDFANEYEGIPYPNPIVLSYDFMKEHVVAMPEYVKQEEQARRRQLEAVLENAASNAVNGIANDMVVGMTLSTFLSKCPNAKLTKSTVNNAGKTIKVYRHNGWEFVFMAGKCTSCSKL